MERNDSGVNGVELGKEGELTALERINSGVNGDGTEKKTAST